MAKESSIPQPIEVKLIQEAPDSICMRVSLGGARSLGYYCVYRFGPAQQLDEIIEMLEVVITALYKKLEEKHDQRNKS